LPFYRSFISKKERKFIGKSELIASSWIFLLDPSIDHVPQHSSSSPPPNPALGLNNICAHVLTLGRDGKQKQKIS
jgi:hypothetical protein